MEDDATQIQPDPRKPRSRALPITLIVLAAIIGLISVFALWAKRQVLETDTWTRTSSELLENQVIRDSVADFMVAALFDNVDVEAEVANVLPPDLKPLAGPATGGLRQLTTQIAQEALSRPKVQALWEDANRAAHAKLIQLLDDKGQFVSTTGGVVTLDLKGIIDQVVATVGLPSTLTSKLPAGASSIEVLRSDQLAEAQTAVKALRALAYVLTALTLILFAIAIWIARGRRRETLRAVGFAFLFIGILVLVLRNAAGTAVTNALTGTAAAGPPVEATWEISTSLLVETAQGLIAYGVAIVIAAWLAGPTSIATRFRYAVTPYLRKPAVAYSALAILLVLLFWWDPVVATHRLVPSLLLIIVLAIGVEALRRQVIREFPDHVTTHSAEGIAQSIGARMTEARESVAARRAAHAGAGATAVAATAAEDSRLASLERLAKLREAGVLTEEELADEKRRIMQGEEGNE